MKGSGEVDKMGWGARVREKKSFVDKERGKDE